MLSRPYFLNSKTVKGIIGFLKRKKFPGIPEITWFAVIEFYFRQVDQRELELRARALSFSFFLSLFPSVLFFFTVIAYIPIASMHVHILAIFEQLLPENTYRTVANSISDIIGKQRGGWLSVGLIFALYFSTNGFHSLMNTLNRYTLQKETRPFFKQRIVAIILAITVSFSLLISVSLITFGSSIFRYVDSLRYFPSYLTPLMLGVLNYMVVAGICITIVSVIYYFGPSRSVHYKFLSPGSVFAAISILLTTTVFSFYVNHFNAYNKVYGSIGAIIVVMFIIYINIYIILLGYELNIAIARAIKEIKENRKIKPNQLVYLKSGSENQTFNHGQSG